VKISYAITVCNELQELKKLVTFLLDHKRKDDEIVITYDSNNGNEEVEDYLRYNHINAGPCEPGYDIQFVWEGFEFKGNFSDLKNHTKSMCSGDYIFHLDADEYPHEILMEQLPSIIEMNDVDLIWVPRVNTVTGINDEWIQKWGWRVSEKGWVNYPDYQARVFINKEDIKWKGKVHEVIGGCKTYAHLPPHEELSLYHPKTIEKQIKQNELYQSL
jgi:hypothetical protein|tara:strand:+ start:8761 stop:9408 length:648 start_codon:yes stop_codon:yes gene_type:complete